MVLNKTFSIPFLWRKNDIFFCLIPRRFLWTYILSLPSKFETLFESYYSSIIFIFLSSERFIEKDIVQCVELIFKEIAYIAEIEWQRFVTLKEFLYLPLLLLPFFELFVSKKVLNTPIYTFEKLQATIQYIHVIH